MRFARPAGGLGTGIGGVEGRRAPAIEGRRYLGLEVLKRARATTVPNPTTAPEEVPTNDIPALSAWQLQEDHAETAKHHAPGLDPRFLGRGS
jgi:hypothetical protein